MWNNSFWRVINFCDCLVMRRIFLNICLQAKKSVVKILDRAWTGLKSARTDSPSQWEALHFIDSAKSPSAGWLSQTPICRSTNGELAESIKCSASDRLVEPVPQVWARTFPGFFHDIWLLGICLEIIFSCTIMSHPSQTFLSSIVLLPWFNVLFVFL